MKKTLLGLAILSFIGLSTNGAFAGYYYQAPNAGNMSFYPMMQRQMEQQKTTTNSNASGTNIWFCTECGVKNTGNFCSDCGTKRATAASCSNCGYQPTGEIPKFCPECGNKF